MNFPFRRPGGIVDPYLLPSPIIVPPERGPFGQPLPFEPGIIPGTVKPSRPQDSPIYFPPGTPKPTPGEPTPLPPPLPPPFPGPDTFTPPPILTSEPQPIPSISKSTLQTAIGVIVVTSPLWGVVLLRQLKVI